MQRVLGHALGAVPVPSADDTPPPHPTLHSRPSRSARLCRLCRARSDTYMCSCRVSSTRTKSRALSPSPVDPASARASQSRSSWAICRHPKTNQPDLEHGPVGAVEAAAPAVQAKGNSSLPPERRLWFVVVYATRAAFGFIHVGLVPSRVEWLPW